MSMRNLQKIFEKCLADIQALNITVGKITKIEWAVLKNALGECNGQWAGNGWIYWIAISNEFLDEKIDEINLRETVYHEILHTVYRCSGHSKTWVRNALLIDKTYGCGVATYKSKYDILNPNLPVLGEITCSYCGGKLSIREKSIWEQIQNQKKALCAWCRKEIEVES